MPLARGSPFYQYHKLPGTDTTIPIMSLGEDLMKMSLKSSSKPADPAAEASKIGKTPTLGEVKRSLKVEYWTSHHFPLMYMLNVTSCSK